MTDVAYAWAPITKTEEQDDGTLMVYGPAASSDLDRDQQRLNADWLDRAMPEWAQIGNIREQHDAKRAVGVGVGLSKADDGQHHIAAHIVDESAVKKIKAKVLKGFSVGIKNPKVVLGKADAPGGEVVDGSICEISVVDRPCNPNTLFEIAKADGAGALEAVEGAGVVEKTDAEAFGIPDELYERLPDVVRTALTTLAAAGAAVSTDAVKAEGTPNAGVVVSSPSLLLKLDGLPVTEDMLRGLVDERVSEQLGALDKADLSAAGRRKAAASGAAMPDGSYPIKTKSDLRKAIKAVGRGNADHSAIRKHIIKRAKALGLESMVPENWNADGSLKDANKSDADETMVAKAEQVLRDVRALAPSLTKADDGESASEEVDESEDIANAEQAIAVIAKLIIAEAESLAMGNLNEACDIDLLLSAVRSLTWFKRREEAEQAGGSDMELADKPPKKTPAAPATTDGDEDDEEEDEDDDEASKSEAPTLTKADVTELVKSAVAEANKAAEERTTALAADLAKAQQTIDELRALPQPGGPVLTRTTIQEAEARKSDAAILKAQADEYLAKADQCSDRYLADGYREKAQELLAKADA